MFSKALDVLLVLASSLISSAPIHGSLLNIFPSLSVPISLVFVFEGRMTQTHSNDERKVSLAR